MDMIKSDSANKSTGQFDFNAMLERHNIIVSPDSIETLWVNITRLCNQTCTHCHVEAAPSRTEHMSRDIIDRCLSLLAQNDCCKNLDITGGAPELHPYFDYFVIEARKLGKSVMVRHNLTVILDGNPKTGEDKKYLPEFFAENNVEIIASLPGYQEDYTDRQRGEGVFKKSIESLRMLNAQGYGKAATGLILNLVHNCDGSLSPAEKAILEADYKRELFSNYNIVFNKLYAVTNMPINRFYLNLYQAGKYDTYMSSLVNSFNPAAVKELVCRSLISVGYDGKVYDCDFNQMLGLQISDVEPVTVFNIDFEKLLHRTIRFDSHCFGCTAGGGSS